MLLFPSFSYAVAQTPENKASQRSDTDKKGGAEKIPKEVKENGENENEVLSVLLREYLEDLRDAKELDKAIEESDGKFYSLNDVIKELGFENELL